MNQGTDNALPIFERKLADDFVRPCTVTDVAEVLSSIPTEFAMVWSACTSWVGPPDRPENTLVTYGMYWRDRIFCSRCPHGSWRRGGHVHLTPRT